MGNLEFLGEGFWERWRQYKMVIWNAVLGFKNWKFIFMHEAFEGSDGGENGV